MEQAQFTFITILRNKAEEGEKGDGRGALVRFLWCIHDLTVQLQYGKKEYGT